MELKKLDGLTIDYPDIKKTSLIKLDIEGYELFGLMGARDILNKSRPYLIIETGHYKEQGYSEKDVFDFIKNAGYIPFAMINQKQMSTTDLNLNHKDAISVNRVCIPNEKVMQIRNLIK